MKTSIYIEDGIVQLVLTPENKFEHEAVWQFKAMKLRAQVFEGSFYDCRGGWVRQKNFYGERERQSWDTGTAGDTSIILCASDEPIEPSP